MSRLTKPDYKIEVTQTLSGTKQRNIVELEENGKITSINGVAYNALEMALFKLKRLEDMIDKGELVDVTVFDKILEDGTFENSSDDDTIITVCDEELTQYGSRQKYNRN